MLFRNKSYETKNEVVINLLPEKAKRDYILRMVASIIVMIFLIINFFTIFLPRINRVSQINHLKRQNHSIISRYDNMYAIFGQIPIQNYDIQKNNDYLTIVDDELYLKAVVDDIKALIKTFEYSYLEIITYNTVSDQLILNIQFIDRNHVDEFIKEAELITYIDLVEIKSHSKVNVGSDDGLPRQKIVYTINLNMNEAPKGGVSND